MKNSFINRLENTITVRIKGKNIERFIKRIVKLKIDLLKINYIKYNEVLIRIKKEDFERLEEVKTIYEVDVLEIHGMDKLKNILFQNRYIILSLLLGLILLLYLCNTCFSVEVIHNDEEIRNLLLEELNEKGIKKYHTKKNYQQLQKIKKEILEKYKEKIEWLEIENVGTKYIVRVEERIITKEDKTYQKRDIVAKKDALILFVKAKQGEIVVPKNTYVKKGDTIITGDIKLYDTSKNRIMAEGEVYGEVWYKVTIEYPLSYKEERITGKKKTVLAVQFLHKQFDLFNFHPFQNKKIEEKVLLEHSFLPIKFVIQKQKELDVIEEDLNEKQAIDKAIEEAKEKIQSKLKEKEYIIDTKKLKVEKNNSKIVLEVFFSVCENITDYKELAEIVEE